MFACKQVPEGYDAGVPSTSTTRETLLEAALRLLEERGPGALRVRDVAAAAEQSTMGVYTHFGSKQGLLEQLYLHGFERLEERLEGRFPPVTEAGGGCWRSLSLTVRSGSTTRRSTG